MQLTRLPINPRADLQKNETHLGKRGSVRKTKKTFKLKHGTQQSSEPHSP